MARGVEARRIAYQLGIAQLGVMARRQLRAEGLSSRLISHWLCSGHMLKVLPGVYTLGRPVTDEMAAYMAAVLLGGPDSALAGLAAASAHGFADRPDSIDVVRASGSPRAVRGIPPHQDLIINLRRARFSPDDVQLLGPVPVLDPARLLIDLAGRLSPLELRRRFIEAGREGLLTPECLSRIETRGSGFKGRSLLLKLQKNWDPTKGKIRSILEGEFKLLCAEQRVPPPLTNQRVGKYEVDCLWDEFHLIVELDGRKFHSDSVAVKADTDKSRHLRDLGYRVRRFTWLDVVERPEWVVNEILREMSLDRARIS